MYHKRERTDTGAFFGINGSNDPDQKGIATKGDFRQASHTIQKIQKMVYRIWMLKG